MLNSGVEGSKGYQLDPKCEDNGIQFCSWVKKALLQPQADIGLQKEVAIPQTTTRGSRRAL